MARSNYLLTNKPSWEIIRGPLALASVDTALTTFDYASLPPIRTRENTDTTIYKSFRIPIGWNGITIAAFGTRTAADNEYGTYTLFGRAGDNGPLIAIASGVITLGTKLVTKNPITGATQTAYWADTITNTIVERITPVEIVNSAGNDICLMDFDAKWAQDLFCQLIATQTAATLTVIGIGY